MTISRSRFIACLALAASISITAVCVLPAVAWAGTHVSGDISVSTTWTAEESPYTLDFVSVGPDATLTIMPGTRVIAEPEVGSIGVSGTLVAVGTTASPIGFDHVSVLAGASGPRQIYLDHARFRSRGPNLEWAGLHLTNSVLIGWSPTTINAGITGISHNVFTGMRLIPTAGGVFRDNTLLRADVNPFWPSTLVTANNFVLSRLIQPMNSKTGSPQLDATNNWWGSTETSAVTTHIVDNYNLVAFSPFLMAPSPTAPTVESTPPVSTLDGVPADWVSHDVSLALRASDNEGGSGVYDSYITTGYARFHRPNVEAVVTEEGSSKIEYWSEDFFGNVETRNVAYVKIDKTAPVTTSDAAIIYVGPALINLTPSDLLSGLALTEWSVDASDWTIGTAVAVSTAGSHTLHFRSTDILGHVEDTKSVDFEVLLPSQVLVSSTSANSLAYGSEFTVAGSLRSDNFILPSRSVVLQSAAPGGSYKDTSVSATTSFEGSFKLSVRPTAKTYYRVRFERSGVYAASRSNASVCAVPKAWVRTPVAPSTMSRSKSYPVYGYLKPKHTAGTYPVRIYKYRYASGKWKPYGYVSAKASNYSSYTKYAGKVKLTTKGKWRMRAYAPVDGGHAATWSSGYDYVTVK